jgi:MOSC domain-containing protein YiiM
MKGTATMQGTIEAIFIVPSGGDTMQRATEVQALADCGLEGDRYCRRTGFWTGVDECEATFIQAEHLEEITRNYDVRVDNGEHRRNIVTRGIRLDDLRGRRFQAGEAVFEYDRPRPPCSYIEGLTEPGMTRALMGRGGICARVVRSGRLQVGDAIDILEG